MGFFVDLDHLDLDGLANGQDFGGVIDPAPCHVSHVQQAVHTAQIDECAVFGDVFDNPINRIAFGQFSDDFGALFGTAFFEDRTTRNNDIAPAAVHLEDLERLFHPHERAGIAHRAHIDLRSGQEGHGTAKIDGKSTLDPAKNSALDTGIIRIGFFQTIPGFFTARHLA